MHKQRRTPISRLLQNIQTANSHPQGDVRTLVESRIQEAIRLQLTFTPAEIVVASADHAYATSTSSGPVTVLATGQTSVNNYRELWAFKRESNQWKIDRYFFNQP